MVAAGRVSTPEATVDAWSIVVPDDEPVKVTPEELKVPPLITGEVRVLFVRVWVSVVPTIVPEGGV